MSARITVTPYRPGQDALWDAFVRTSKNGWFLFERGYMDYHRDRFEDRSLVAWVEGKPAALLPAHADGAAGIASHGGLTFGGWITDAAMTTPRMLELFEAALAHLAERAVTHWVYKEVPHIFHRLPAEEDRHALFLCGSQLVRRDVHSVLAGGARPPLQDRRRRAVRKAHARGLRVQEDPALDGFWRVLQETLAERHGVQPVHTLPEIQLLAARFPANIRLFTSRRQGSLLGGVLIYESERVARVQYIASTEEGRRHGAVDAVFDHLLAAVYRDKPFVDFGASGVDGGRRINRGLIEQKEGFGARAVVTDHYRLEVAGWRPGRLLEALS